MSTDEQSIETTEGDKTQPSEELLEVLRQLNGGSNHTPPVENPPVKVEESVPPVATSEWDRVLARLRTKPHEEQDWSHLIDLAERSGDEEKVKQAYDGLLKTFPNTSSAQIAYLNYFLNLNAFTFAEDLFKSFLKTSPSVDLWKFYLVYVRRVNSGPATRDVVRQAYEFALNRVGQDKDSGDIWSDYIQFLKAGETTTTWEEQQKMDALRKVYHRAVQIPLENVETLWRELGEFENSLNKITAKKFLTDLSPSYITAKTMLRELRMHLGTLFPPPAPSPVGGPALQLPRPPTFNQSERALVGTWKTYLKWEESNPLLIDEKDKATLVQRIQGVYRKAVIKMRFFSEIWFMAYYWTDGVGKPDEALAILKSGIEANPKSFLLNFKYVDALEAKERYQDVNMAYMNFIEVLHNELDTLENTLASANSSLSSIDSATGPAAPNLTSILAADTLPGQPNPTATEAGSKDSSFSSQRSDDKLPKDKVIADRRTDFGLVWINYMHFAHKAEGLQSSRNIFGKARKDKWTPWEVYEAAALREYHCTKDSGTEVAYKIFEKGLQIFGDEVEFVLRYLGFLISLNDEKNARALFERVIVTFPNPNHARPLWERWARYEYSYGDLAAAQKLEKRLAEVYPLDPPIKRFAQRYTYLGRDAIAARDLGFGLRQGGGNAGPSNNNNNNALGRTDTVNNLLVSNSQANQPPSLASAAKRDRSPDYRKRRDEARVSDEPPSYKRQRPLSPPRDRDRYERRRPGSPTWSSRDRERDRDPSPPRRLERDREEEKPSTLPTIISWFVGTLPNSGSFDGPVFRTEDLMQVFRNAVIPSSTGPPRVRSPPPRAGGRPPPDYGPYQGPGGGRGARRY